MTSFPVDLEDPSSSCVSVFLPMDLEEGWLDEQRRLLGRVLGEWPSEVLQSSSGGYEWPRSPRRGGAAVGRACLVPEGTAWRSGIGWVTSSRSLARRTSCDRVPDPDFGP
ncbi:DUF5959 family protein [Streptomyces sp. NPDC004266]|uniref:DUF5959 family protein n=1 Tax=Streptomyces sp. NPDC004266 TaxID=3364693 RepID=UPI0036BB77DE